MNLNLQHRPDLLWHHISEFVAMTCAPAVDPIDRQQLAIVPKCHRFLEYALMYLCTAMANL